MDDKQRTEAATQQDPKLAARIVRNLKQIEDDYHLASEVFSEKLMLAAVQVLKKAVTDPFQVVETDWTATIVQYPWRSRGVGQDFWIELAEVGGDEERDYTWLTAATAVGPTRLALVLMCRRGLQESYSAVTKDEKLLQTIWTKAPIVLDETEGRLFVPIVIPAEKLAQGLEQGDLDPVLTPVTKAWEQVLTAKDELEALVERVRAAAKK